MPSQIDWNAVGGQYGANQARVGSFQKANAAFQPQSAPSNTGKPTSAWLRLAQQGAAKTASVAQGIGSFIGNTVKGTIKDAAQLANQSVNMANSVGETIGAEAGLAAQKLGAKKLGTKVVSSENKQMQQTYNKYGNSGGILNAGTVNTKQEAQNPTLKSGAKIAGRVIEIGSLAIPGGGRAVVDIGAQLLKHLGETGVKELAVKAGVSTAGRAATDVAQQVAKSGVGKTAYKTLTQSGGKALASQVMKTAANGALTGGIYNGAQATSTGASKKEIAKSTLQGAAAGAALGAGGTLAGKLVSKVAGKYNGNTAFGAKVKDMAATHQDNLNNFQKQFDKTQATNKIATTKGLPQGKITSQKSLPQGSVTKALPQGEKVPVRSDTSVTVKGTTATPKTIPLSQSEYQTRFSNISKSYDQKTKAASLITNPVKQKTVLANVEKTHMDMLNQLDDESKNGKVNPDYKPGSEDKTVSTGFVKQTDASSKTATVVNDRVSQIDKVVAAAQKSGTNKSAGEMRSLMKERSSLLDVASGKKSVEDVQANLKDSPALAKLKGEANKISGNEKSTIASTAKEETGTTSKTTVTEGAKTTAGGATKAEIRAVKEGVVTEFANKDTYLAHSYAKNAESAANLVHDNPKKAMDIATGKISGNNMVHESAVFHAVKEKALKEGDVSTIQKLASSGHYTKTSEAAQKLGAEGYNAVHHDPVKAIQEIRDARQAAFEKNSKTTVREEASKVIESVNKVTKAPSKNEWASLIESLRC